MSTEQKPSFELLERVVAAILVTAGTEVDGHAFVNLRQVIAALSFMLPDNVRLTYDGKKVGFIRIEQSQERRIEEMRSLIKEAREAIAAINAAKENT